MQYDLQFNVTSLMTHYLLQTLLLIDSGHLPLQKGQFLFEGINKILLTDVPSKNEIPPSNLNVILLKFI